MWDKILVLLKMGEWLNKVSRGQARKEKELRKTHVLATLRHAESKNPAPLVFPIAKVSEMTGISPSDLMPVLEELEREGRMFWSSLGSFTGYSLRRMPWE